MRRPVGGKGARGRQVSEVVSWPAPVKGWFESESIADMPAGSAFRLDNWFPETTSLVIRPGFESFATFLEDGTAIGAVTGTATVLGVSAAEKRSVGMIAGTSEADAVGEEA